MHLYTHGNLGKRLVDKGKSLLARTIRNPMLYPLSYGGLEVL